MTNSTNQLFFDDVPEDLTPVPTTLRPRQFTDVGSDRPATVSVTEAAHILGISRTTAYEAVRDGSMRSIRIRRRIVVPRSWLDEVLEIRDPRNVDPSPMRDGRPGKALLPGER